MSRKTKAKPEQPVTYKGYNKYEVNFTDNKKHVTRTVNTYAVTDQHAEMIVHTNFGSFKPKEIIPTPSNRITINKVTKIEDAAQ